MSDRHEARVLLEILAQRWDAAARRTASRPVDPDTFVAVCRASDVHPLVHALLEPPERASIVGPRAIEALAGLRAKTRVDNLLLLARLEEALDLLLADGIRPIALKGADVLHRLYTAFDERTLDDVDLLVPREQRDRAIALLEGAGWRGPSEPERTHWFRSSFELPLASPGPVPVAFEIHWSLGQAKRYRVDAGALFRRAVPAEVAGRGVLRLEDHDAVAHLLLHHVQHYFDRRLKWIVEIGRIARQAGFRWSEVAARLESWGGRGAAGLALAHVGKLFPDIATTEARAAIPLDAWRSVIGWPLRSGHPLDYYRGTRRRTVQLVLAAAALEHPSELPGYLRHRAVRDRHDEPV